jgi:uncharacterized protein (DUF2267 family)
MVVELQLRRINNAVLNEAREVLSEQMGGLQVSSADLPMKIREVLSGQMGGLQVSSADLPMKIREVLSGQMGGLQVSSADLPLKTLSLLWAACRWRKSTRGSRVLGGA